MKIVLNLFLMNNMKMLTVLAIVLFSESLVGWLIPPTSAHSYYDNKLDRRGCHVDKTYNLYHCHPWRMDVKHAANVISETVKDHLGIVSDPDRELALEKLGADSPPGS